MSVRYSSWRVLKNALSEGNCEIVHKCLQAGQSFNSINEKGFSILLDVIDDDNTQAVMTLMAFEKSLDLNSKMLHGSTGSVWTPISLSYRNVGITHLLLQAGVDLSGDFGDFHPFFLRIDMFHFGSLNDTFAMLLMLLACGMEPDDESINVLRQGHRDHDEEDHEPFIIKTRDVLVKASRKWLQNLQCSREMFRDIFDNEELENDLCSFIYNEKCLRKITLNLQ